MAKQTKLTIDLEPDGEALSLSGAMTFPAVEACGRRILTYFETHIHDKTAKEIVVSASQVSEVDSAGLSLLTEMMLQAKSKGARFILTQKSKQMMALMTFYGVLALFPKV